MRRPLLVVSALTVTLVTPLASVAQDVTAPALKAAFIYNFVKFTEWPGLSPAPDPFVICVIGDAAVSDALELVVEGREFVGRRIAVATTISQPGVCRVLYLSGTMTSEALRAVAALQDSPVLTISDIMGFTDTGGMAHFFFERAQLRFTISATAVKRSGLKMSSKLLTMGQR